MAIAEYKRAILEFQTWIFSMCVKSAIHNDKISYDSLTQDFKDIYVGEHADPYRFGDIKTWSVNLVNTAKGACFIAFDEAFDSIYGNELKKNPSNYSGKKYGALRILVYMIRCAFAHNPSKPKWQVYGQYEEIGKLKLPDIGFEITISTLHGEPLKDSQFGGSKRLIKLMEYCLSIIKEDSRQSA